jgi:hypothetical protein
MSDVAQQVDQGKSTSPWRQRRLPLDLAVPRRLVPSLQPPSQGRPFLMEFVSASVAVEGSRRSSKKGPTSWWPRRWWEMEQKAYRRWREQGAPAVEEEGGRRPTVVGERGAGHASPGRDDFGVFFPGQGGIFANGGTDGVRVHSYPPW